MKQRKAQCHWHFGGILPALKKEDGKQIEAASCMITQNTQHTNAHIHVL